MRPLIHPEIADVPLELMLHALADPVRVAIFADIVKQDCSQSCSSFLTVGEKQIPKSTLSQHFKILREAGLIRSERRGVEMHNTSRCAEVDARYPGMLAAIANAHQIQMNAREKTTAKKRSTRR
ncbi:ArsR/SmtB family transcription factor [Granulicella paludicola]|uniref:ArsR/SmtB family transcription factor n=1 Tax=Granulicella paludicola TaxID=474951 RepID=UPI0021E09EE0|nr:helix-turn-helix domain-containing protein [Granulicella paludicola]